MKDSNHHTWERYASKLDISVRHACEFSRVHLHTWFAFKLSRSIPTAVTDAFTEKSTLSRNANSSDSWFLSQENVSFDENLCVLRDYDIQRR